MAGKGKELEGGEEKSTSKLRFERSVQMSC